MTAAKKCETRAFGLWPSPITPESLAQGRRLSDVAWDTDGQTIVWLEGRSDRGVLVSVGLDGDAPRDLTGERSVRAQVGYGGGDFTVARGQVYFAERDGRLYRQPLGAGAAEPLTPGFGHAASPAVSPDGQWLLYVHSYERADRLAVVDTAGRHWPRQLASGRDFYMQPRWHPQGTQIIWIAWDHPRMPWDGTELCLATVRLEGDGPPTLGEVEVLAGGAETAIFQPEFAPDGSALAYISNATGWDNLYLYDFASRTHRQLTHEEADLGAPAWSQGMRTYAFGHDGRALYYLRTEGAFRTLWRYDLAREEAQPCAALDGYSWASQLVAAPDRAALVAIASSATVPARVVLAVAEPVAGEGDSTAGGWRQRVLGRATGESVPAADLSTPRAVSWPAAGPRAIDTAHGLYYPPASSRFTGSGLPPAIVHVHGGPTGQASSGYDAATQFFTTRGYAVLEVNHRGSSGYGRAYLQALREQWGVYDVEDTVAGARYLGEAGLADPGRLVIMGGSAGGYTVLQCLVHHPGVFKAALCLYGVANLFTLAADTHKFEERYLDSLIGPLPEMGARYRERSPIFFADRIQDPVAIFQGAIDQVVPPNQSAEIVAALRRRGVPHEYHVYEGEGHGWRKSETIATFYNAVDRFLRQYVLFS